MAAIGVLKEIFSTMSSFSGGGNVDSVFDSRVSKGMKSAASSYSSYDIPIGINKIRSLAEKAREGVLMYPMLISEKIQELNLTAVISKYQEVQYALFTMIVAGFNPVAMAGDSTVGSYINAKIGAESNKIKNIEDAPKASIEKNNSKDEVDRAKELVNDSMAAYDFGDKKDDVSLEATFGSGTIDQVQVKKGPTIVTIKITFPGSGDNQTVSVPIIVKCVPHILQSDEIIALFQSTLQDKNFRQRWVKWTTGEISLFKDLIFQVDLAKKNKEDYKKLGRHPWMKNLENRKLLSLLNDNLTSKIDHAEITPTATLVLTKEELVESTKLSYAFILKNQDLLFKIIDKLFLMGIVVYDVDMEIFNIFYAGYQKPMIYTLGEMKSADSDVQKDLTKIISTLSTKL